MKRLLLSLVVIGTIGFLGWGVGGCGGTASDNPPDVAGIYDCTLDCSSICEYSGTVEIEQDGDRVSGFGENGTGVGSVDNEGHFDFDGETAEGVSTSCDGWFVGDVLTIECSGGGMECQQARYERR